MVLCKYDNHDNTGRIIHAPMPRQSQHTLNAVWAILTKC